MTRYSAVRFGRGGAIIKAPLSGSLSLEQVEHHVPAVFAEEPHSTRSDKFVAIPTVMAIRALINEGFVITEARQGGSRDEEKRGFTKHRLRLRHRTSDRMAPTLGGLMPEVILTNGNDGTSAYWLESGLMRVVCLNGLIYRDPSCEVTRVRHGGRPDQVIDAVVQASLRVLETTPQVIDAAAAMSVVTLTRAEAVAFAETALETRWALLEDGRSTAPIDADAVLRPRRHEDARSDLWDVFNRVQENLIRGGQTYRSTPTLSNPRGQRRVVSEVKSGTQDTVINRALWSLAARMAEIKAAA